MIANLKGFYQFVRAMEVHAGRFGWTLPDGIFTVNIENDGDVEKVNLLKKYGTVSLERLQKVEAKYIPRRYGRHRTLECCLIASTTLYPTREGQTERI